LCVFQSAKPARLNEPISKAYREKGSISNREKDRVGIDLFRPHSRGAPIANGAGFRPTKRKNVVKADLTTAMARLTKRRKKSTLNCRRHEIVNEMEKDGTDSMVYVNENL
jgi:hypothetical protein